LALLSVLLTWSLLWEEAGAQCPPAINPNQMFVNGTLNPRDILSSVPRFSWFVPPGVTQTNWQIQVDSDPNFATPLWFWDSGTGSKSGAETDSNIPYGRVRVPTGNHSGDLLPIDTRPHLIYYRLRIQNSNDPTWAQDPCNFSYGTFKMNQMPLSPVDPNTVADTNPGLVPSANFPPLNPSPREFFVSPGGSDSNPGTAGAPFRTINRGIRALAPGDKLTLRSGTYGENVEIRTGSGGVVSGQPGNPITIRSDPNASSPAIIRGLAGGTQPYAPLRIIGASGRIKHWTVDGVRLGGSSVAFGAFVNSAEYITLRNISFTSTFNTSATGVQFIGGGDGNRVLDSTFDRNMFDHIDVAGSKHVEIRRNVFENFLQHSAIQVHVGGSLGSLIADNIFRHGRPTAGAVAFYISADGGILRNNLIYDVKSPPQGLGTAVQILRSGKILIENNTIVDCDFGITWGQYTGFSTVRNNIFVRNDIALDFGLARGGQSPPDQHTASRGAVIDHNFLYNNTVHLDLAYRPEDESQIDMFANCPVFDANLYPGSDAGCNPLFVDPNGGNFHLSPGSPAIDAGDPNVPVPIGGGGARDAGVFESGAAGFPRYSYQPEAVLGDSTPRFSWSLRDVDNLLHAMLPADFPDVHVQFGFELQVDPNTTFDSVNGSRPFFSSGKTVSGTEAYTIPNADALPPGEYYVRVSQADDHFSPLGQWSNGSYRIRLSQEPDPPSLTLQDPAPGAMGVDPNVTVTARIADFGTGVDSNSIQVSVGVNDPNAPTAVAPQITQVGGSASEFEITFTPSSFVSISSGDVIYVRVRASDLDFATGPNWLDSGSSWSFTIRDTQPPGPPAGFMVAP
jgi:hypothetical protein